MLICDKCRAPVKTRVVEFGHPIAEWRYNPNFDLCEQCEKEALDVLEKFIGTKARIDVSR